MTTLDSADSNQELLQVSKPVPNVATFEALCNKLAAGSFNEREREVNFQRLDDVTAQAVGLFGYNEDVWKVLHDHGANFSDATVLYSIHFVSFRPV